MTGVREVGAPVFGGGGVGCRIYGIRRVCFLPLSTQHLDSNALTALGLHPCAKHLNKNSVYAYAVVSINLDENILNIIAT